MHASAKGLEAQARRSTLGSALVLAFAVKPELSSHESGATTRSLRRGSISAH